MIKIGLTLWRKVLCCIYFLLVTSSSQLAKMDTHLQDLLTWLLLRRNWPSGGNCRVLDLCWLLNSIQSDNEGRASMHLFTVGAWELIILPFAMLVSYLLSSVTGFSRKVWNWKVYNLKIYCSNDIFQMDTDNTVKQNPKQNTTAKKESAEPALG